MFIITHSLTYGVKAELSNQVEQKEQRILKMASKSFLYPESKWTLHLPSLLLREVFSFLVHFEQQHTGFRDKGKL